LLLFFGLGFGAACVIILRVGLFIGAGARLNKGVILHASARSPKQLFVVVVIVTTATYLAPAAEKVLNLGPHAC